MTQLILIHAWYTPRELAMLLHVSRVTVYRWIEAGKICPLCTLKPIRIPRSEVKKILATMS